MESITPHALLFDMQHDLLMKKFIFDPLLHPLRALSGSQVFTCMLFHSLCNTFSLIYNMTNSEKFDF